MEQELFNLSEFENLSVDDIMDLQINESSEFATKSYVNTGYENGVNGTTVSIPGGDKETPTAKPYDENEVSIPDGDSEKPTAKPYDENEIPIPATTTLSEEQYNKAITLLKKSFTEGADICAMLENATIVHKTPEDLQKEYMENVMDDAYLLSLEDGPLFESVARGDKNAIKAIVRKIRYGIESGSVLKDANFRPASRFIRNIDSLIKTALTAGLVTAGSLGAGGAAVGAASGILMKLTPKLLLSCAINHAAFWATIGGIIGTFSGTVGGAVEVITNVFNHHSWQIIGVTYLPEHGYSEIIDKLNDEFKDDLGKFKIIGVPCNSLITDALGKKFSWKDDNGKSYLLIIDQKLPEEMKAISTEVEIDVESLKKNVNEDDKGGSKKK